MIAQLNYVLKALLASASAAASRTCGRSATSPTWSPASTASRARATQRRPQCSWPRTGTSACTTPVELIKRGCPVSEAVRILV